VQNRGWAGKVGRWSTSIAFELGISPDSVEAILLEMLPISQ
jgi:hypothetical protein